MIPSKIKANYYLANRFKELPEVIKWFEYQEGISTTEEIYELWCYFKRKCLRDLDLLTICSFDLQDLRGKITRTAEIRIYCNENIQRVIREKYKP